MLQNLLNSHMPKQLMSCVSNLKSKKGESSAYAICSSKTGWVRKKGGGWKNKKTGKTFNENSEFDNFVFSILESLDVVEEAYKDEMDYTIELPSGDEQKITVEYLFSKSKYKGDRYGRFGNPTPPDPDEAEILNIYDESGKPIDLLSIFGPEHTSKLEERIYEAIYEKEGEY